MDQKDFADWLDKQRDSVDFILRWVNLMESDTVISMDPIEFSQGFNRLRHVVRGLNENNVGGDYLLVGYEAKVSRYKVSLYVCNGVDVDNVYTLLVKKK